MDFYQSQEDHPYETLDDLPWARVFNTTCMCSDPKHYLRMIVEADEELSNVLLRFETNLAWCDWWGYEETLSWKDRWFGYWYRIKIALKLLWSGHLIMSEEFLFRSSEHARSIADALYEAADHVEKYIEKYKDKE